MDKENSMDAFEITLPPDGIEGGYGYADMVGESPDLGEGIQDPEVTPQIESVEEFDTVLKGLIVASAQNVSIEEIKQSLNSHLKHLNEQ